MQVIKRLSNLSSNLKKLQNRTAQILTSALHSKSSAEIFSELGWISLAEMRHQHKAIMMLKVVNGLCPSYLSHMFTFHKTLNDYSLRSSNTDLVPPKTRTNYYKIGSQTMESSSV